MIHLSRPSPWVRPGSHVAICVTDGMNEPQGWLEAKRRDAWLTAHSRAFPDHEIHQFHAAEQPAKSTGPQLRLLCAALRLLGRAADLFTGAAAPHEAWRIACRDWRRDYDQFLTDGEQP